MANKISIERKRLEELYNKVNDFDDDSEMKSHWVKYLCILSSGHIENSLRFIYSDYAENKSHQNIANFVNTKLKSLQNPTTDKIIKTTSSFNKEWGSELDAVWHDSKKLVKILILHSFSDISL